MAYDQPAPSLPPHEADAKARRPKAVDLFCGIGGMSLGFEQAGFDVVCAVDFDPLLAAIHKFNHPNTRTVCEDVASLKGRAREALSLGEIELDVVFGGPPCQGFSSIGKRQVDDARNDLVASFITVATELAPKYIVMENVEGFLQTAMKPHLDRAKALLSASDYKFAEPRKADASEFGVPQRRRRVFLIAWKSSETAPEWPIATHGNEGSGRVGHLTVKDAIGDIGGAARTTKSAYAEMLGRLVTTGMAAARTGSPGRLTGIEGTTHSAKTIKRFEATEQGKEEPVSRYTRLNWSGLCHTLRAGTGPDHGAFMSARPIHPSEPRVITVREAARLHGYPDWFQFHRTKWHSFRGIGNSVPPPMAKAVAGALASAAGLSPPQADPVELGPERLLLLTPAEAAREFGRPANTLPKRRRNIIDAK